MSFDYKYEKHQKLCQKMNDTYRRKNETYHDSFGRTFKKYGPISALTRLSDKFERFENLTLGAKNLVPDETMVDTLLDMANYCLMTIIEMEDAEAGRGTIAGTSSNIARAQYIPQGETGTVCPPPPLSVSQTSSFDPQVRIIGK